VHVNDVMVPQKLPFVIIIIIGNCQKNVCFLSISSYSTMFVLVLLSIMVIYADQ